PYSFWNSGNLRMEENVLEELKEISVLPPPCLPVLVVIINAPLEAREPYNAAAAGPFRIVTEAISSGLISLPLFPKSTLAREDDPPITLELSIGTPSTTINA